MHTLSKSGSFLYGMAILFLGIEQFITGNFPVALLPVPADTPGRSVLVYAVGTALVIAGLCIIFQKKADWAAVSTGILFLLLDAVIHLPKLIATPYNGGEWTVFTELIALAGGAFLLQEQFPADFSGTSKRQITHILICIGWIAYTLSLLIFGIQHIMFGPYVATLIPSWIPAHLFWAYFVGLAFLGAAISILSRRQVSLAATWLGVLFISWVILLHAPRVFSNPHQETEWTSLFIALAMGGISFSLAYSPMFNRVRLPLQNTNNSAFQ